MKIGIISLLMIFATSFAFGQNDFRCITDSLDAIEVEKNPIILERRAELEEFTKAYSEQKTKSDEMLIIPIVFHVLHQYGDERISYEVIERSVERLNKDYIAQNSEINGIASDFRDIIGITNVEFRLAKVDPEGNCTNGVVYYETELTNNATNDLKYTIRNWAPESYLNVWTVSSIDFSASAWSHYPGISSTLDGVVSIHRYITSGHILSHEIGHYLNLIHPWGNSNTPGVESNCNTDDNVGDTPNTMGTSGSCNLAQETCGSLDNVQNIMDYSSCENMFTKGQSDRMRAALKSSVSNRNNLWTSANLTKTGTKDGYIGKDCNPLADFSSQEHTICQGDVVEFSGLVGAGSVSTWKWEFEQGEPSNSSLQNPVVKYNVPGEYKVTLKVVNAYDQNTLVRQKLISVIDTLGGIVAPILYNMEDADFPNYGNDLQNRWNFVNNENSNWESYTLNGNTAFRIKNQKNTYGTKNSIISPNINLANIDNPDYIYFDYAFAQRNSSNYDELKVLVSINCGKSWSTRFNSSGKSLVTNGGDYVSDNYIPKSGEWRTGKIDLSYNKNDAHLHIKFEMTSKGGNTMYIDNLQIGTPTISIRENILDAHILNAYPNPASSEINITYTANVKGKTQLCIYNVLGTIVYQVNNLEKESDIVKINIDKNTFNSGIYIVELNTKGNKSFTRFVIADK